MVDCTQTHASFFPSFHLGVQVAFITAIYELRPVLLLDKQRTVLTKAYPKGVRATVRSFHNKPRRLLPSKKTTTQLFVYDFILNDFVCPTSIAVELTSKNNYQIVPGKTVVEMKICRETSSCYIWKVGAMNDQGMIELHVDDAQTTDHRPLFIFQNQNDEGEGDGGEENGSQNKSCCTFSFCRSTSKRGTIHKQSTIDQWHDPEWAVGGSGSGSGDGSGGTQLQKLISTTDLETNVEHGTLYLIDLYNEEMFRYLEIGFINNGDVYQQNNSLLTIFSYLLQFEEGTPSSSTGAAGVDWQPNVVESLRAQGWVQFDSLICCQGKGGGVCGKWHLSCTCALSILWICVVIYELTRIGVVSSGMGHLVVVVGVLELVLIFVLAVASFIVSTDIEVDDKIKGYEKRKLIRPIEMVVGGEDTLQYSDGGDGGSGGGDGDGSGGEKKKNSGSLVHPEIVAEEASSSTDEDENKISEGSKNASNSEAGSEVHEEKDEPVVTSRGLGEKRKGKVEDEEGERKRTHVRCPKNVEHHRLVPMTKKMRKNRFCDHCISNGTTEKNAMDACFTCEDEDCGYDMCLLCWSMYCECGHAYRLMTKEESNDVVCPRCQCSEKNDNSNNIKDRRYLICTHPELHDDDTSVPSLTIICSKCFNVTCDGASNAEKKQHRLFLRAQPADGQFCDVCKKLGKQDDSSPTLYYCNCNSCDYDMCEDCYVHQSTGEMSECGANAPYLQHFLKTRCNDEE